MLQLLLFPVSANAAGPGRCELSRSSTYPWLFCNPGSYILPGAFDVPVSGANNLRRKAEQNKQKKNPKNRIIKSVCPYHTLGLYLRLAQYTACPDPSIPQSPFLLLLSLLARTLSCRSVLSLNHTCRTISTSNAHIPPLLLALPSQSIDPAKAHLPRYHKYPSHLAIGLYYYSLMTRHTNQAHTTPTVHCPLYILVSYLVFIVLT